MATVTPEQVRVLREATGASVMDCKKALEEAAGDSKKAETMLAIRSKAVALKKQSRETKVGIIGSYLHANERVGVLIELFCETDFVARNAKFKELAHDLALQVAALKPAYVDPKNFPADFIAERTQAFLAEAAKERKPAAMQAKIAEGKLAKFLSDNSLLDQEFVKAPGKKVSDVIGEYTALLGEKIAVGRFIRFEI